jgi:hypothetical protein
VSGPLVADVAVNDPVTGGTTVMGQALTYGTPAPTLNLVTAPSGVVPLGQTDAIPFAVLALAADGVTPIAGETITFTASGAVSFGACGANTCSVATNASGIASTGVTPLAAGPLTLSAAGSSGTVTASFTGAVEIRTAGAANPVEYIAAGAVASWTPQVSLSDNLTSTAGVAVTWLPVSGAINVSPGVSSATAQGTAQALATAGPLAAGAQATARACAWATVCATFAAQGVDAADLRIAIVSGAGQSVSASSTLVPVVFQVTDVAGHPVDGASVAIHQTIDAWQAACPARGRCPVAPANGSAALSVASDASGLVTVTPIQTAGAAGITSIAAAIGTQGFVSLSIQKHP